MVSAVQQLQEMGAHDVLKYRQTITEHAVVAAVTTRSMSRRPDADTQPVTVSDVSNDDSDGIASSVNNHDSRADPINIGSSPSTRTDPGQATNQSNAESTRTALMAEQQADLSPQRASSLAKRSKGNVTPMLKGRSGEGGVHLCCDYRYLNKKLS